MRSQTAGIIGVVGIGLAVAACSSGSSATTSNPNTSSKASSSAAAAPATAQASSPAAAGQSGAASTVVLTSITGIPDKALVGSNGRTLYLFEGDKNGMSACSGACAATWPPATVTGTPSAGSGVSQSLVGTIKRADGTMQLMYNGHPLYYFAADTATGSAHGQGVKAFGAEWYAVNASGSKIDTS